LHLDLEAVARRGLIDTVWVGAAVAEAAQGWVMPQDLYLLLAHPKSIFGNLKERHAELVEASLPLH